MMEETQRGIAARANPGRSRTDRSVEGKSIPGLFDFLPSFFFTIQSHVDLMKKGWWRVLATWKYAFVGCGL